MLLTKSLEETSWKKPKKKSKESKKVKEVKTKKSKTEVFDKYWYYSKAVQSAEVDVQFFRDSFLELRGRMPQSFREDFCGTFQLSCEWVKLNEQFRSIGVDLDSEPIEYGLEHNLTKLSNEQQSRLRILQADVLDTSLPKADIIAACNFSYFIFKERNTLKKYFENCRKTLEKDGLLILDTFGGSHCYDPNEEETVHKGFSYFWDQDSYDPVTNEAQFYIHFKPKGEKKIKKVFSYDWRMYSIPEIKDILMDAGFKNVHIYWEGTTKKGEGDGEFKRAEHGEPCESWIAYIIAEN